MKKIAGLAFVCFLLTLIISKTCQASVIYYSEEDTGSEEQGLTISYSATANATRKGRQLAQEDDDSRGTGVQYSTFDVLYITPGDQLSYDVFTLNSKHTFGNNYDRGWLLPADKPLDLFLYIYHDGEDESKIRPFLTQTYPNAGQEKNASKTNETWHKSETGSISAPGRATLTLYLTTEDHCHDFMRYNYRPFEIVEKVASNMYKAKLSQIVIPYSEKPLFICMQQFDFDDNIHDKNRYYSHQGNDYWVSIITTRDLMPIWARIVLFVMLLSLSGLFSGLNLGLMSLDISELDILKRIGTPRERDYATKIYPLRKRGNFLLCSILLGNVLVNSISTLILGDMLSGVYAAFGSTLLIVIFGEIIPQAACSKHGLAVGANTRHVMYFFMALTSPVSFPLSIILDKILGQEIAAPYSREKIRELMNFVEGLDNKEKKIITGALDFNKKKLRDVMTPIESVFMLEEKACLDFELIAKIAQEGYSRIPVYRGDKNNLIGLLHVKDFTLLDPDDNMPVSALLKFYDHKIYEFDAESSIDELFDEFRKGETHLAFVNDIVSEPDKDPVKKIVGIVTLEDILEELVQMEIYDEFDEKREIEPDELAKEEAVEEKNSRSGTPTDGRKKSIDHNNENEPLIGKSEPGTQSGGILLEKSSKLFSSDNKDKNVFFEPDVNENAIQTTSFTTKSALESNAANDESLEKTRKLNTNFMASTKSTTKTPPYEPTNSKDLSFFIEQQKDQSQRALISPQIRFVMFQFLFTTVRPFTHEFLTKNVLELIFKKALFKESKRIESKRIDSKLPPEYLYRYGKGCHYFILILSGEATIEVGKEKLEFPAGPFAYFGVNALLCGSENVDQVLGEDSAISSPDSTSESRSSSSKHSKQYVPDFSLRVDDKCVYMKIDHDLWRNGVIKSYYERKNNLKAETIDDDFNNERCIQFSEADFQMSDNSRLNSNSQQNTSLNILKSDQSYFPTNADVNMHSGRARRSTIAATILAKAQKASDAKLNQLKETESSSQLRLNFQQSPKNEPKNSNPHLDSFDNAIKPNNTSPSQNSDYLSSSNDLSNSTSNVN